MLCVGVLAYLDQDARPLRGGEGHFVHEVGDVPMERERGQTVNSRVLKRQRKNRERQRKREKHREREKERKRKTEKDRERAKDREREKAQRRTEKERKHRDRQRKRERQRRTEKAQLVHRIPPTHFSMGRLWGPEME